MLILNIITIGFTLILGSSLIISVIVTNNVTSIDECISLDSTNITHVYLCQSDLHLLKRISSYFIVIQLTQFIMFIFVTCFVSMPGGLCYRKCYYFEEYSTIRLSKTNSSNLGEY